MSLKLPAVDSKYTSKSQIARKMSEAWAEKNLYCPKCGGPLAPAPNNTPVFDFCCPTCQLQFQLKSFSGPINKTIMGASYQATATAIQNKSYPSLFLLQYDRMEYWVLNVQLIHKDCVDMDCIQKRPALGVNTRRAGFKGFILILPKILRSGRIPIVYEGKELPRELVRQQWASVEKIVPIIASLSGWPKEVMYYIDRLGNNFSMEDFVEQITKWQVKYPNNKNINATVRQQLQVLRDKGLLDFVGKGHYVRK